MDTGPTLIMVCGLPGAGKTMHGQFLAEELGAIRFSPDEWMESLAVNLWDENAKAGIEALQWKLARDLLRLGQNVFIEWGTWWKQNAPRCETKPRPSEPLLNCTTWKRPLTSAGSGSSAGTPSPLQFKRADLERWFEEFEVPDDDETALYDREYRTSA